jgi:hypothetical protein
MGCVGYVCAWAREFAHSAANKTDPSANQGRAKRRVDTTVFMTYLPLKTGERFSAKARLPS